MYTEYLTQYIVSWHRQPVGNSLILLGIDSDKGLVVYSIGEED